MRLRHFEARAQIAASPQKVFGYLDDPARLAAHMSNSSWSMGGGRMTLHMDAEQGRSVGSKMQLSGRAFGIGMQVEEVIIERTPPQRKVWETIGSPRLLIIGYYKLGFELLPVGDETGARVFIDYDLPTGLVSRLLGAALADMYAKWCVTRMVDDALAHFAPSGNTAGNAD